MNVSKNNFSSIEQMTGQYLKKNENPAVRPSEVKHASFAEILSKQKELSEETGLKFSKHANERLASRNIDLSDSQIERLEIGASMAREKGINESLVMVDDLAFIINVKNRTVITAVNDNDEKVFTNIDGAVIM